MIRKLLATTAFAALLATGAWAADTATTAAPATTNAAAATMKADGDHLASNIIGENVYDGAGQDANKIGDVNDLVVGADGKIKSIVVGVGGFLGIGEKNVAMNFSDLKWSDGSDMANASNANTGDRWLVATNATKESLKSAPIFDRSVYDPAPAATSAMNTTANGMATTTDNAAGAGTTGTASNDMTNNMAAQPDATQTTAIDRSKLTAVPEDKLTAETLVGTTVYGANDANVGKIADIVLTKDGKVDAVLLDVGGFLGIGAKRVAVGMDKLSFMQDGNGNRYLYTTFTKDQLNGQAEYNADTYASERESQRMMVR